MDYLFFLAVLIIFPLSVSFGGIHDILDMTIPNELSLILIGSFLFMSVWSGMDIYQFLNHLQGGAITLIVGFSMFSFGWIGGGDAKLTACCGLWFGYNATLIEFVYVSSILGGILTILIIQYRNIIVLPRILHKQQWALRMHTRDEGIPYGVALACAALFVYPNSYWMSFSF